MVNGGDNQLLEGATLVMGKDDIYEVYKASPNKKIISIHMEAVDHWTSSCADLKNFISEIGISSNLLVPVGSESYSF